MSTPLFTRFWHYAGAVSIRTKIMGIVLGLVLLLGAGVTLQMRAGLFRVLEARLAEQSVSVARDLAARSTDLILVNDLFALHQLLRETQENNPDLRYAFIVDHEGVVLAHTFGEGFPADLLTANLVAPTEHHATQILQTDEGSIWDTAVPIFEGQAGTARIGLSEESVYDSVALLTGQVMLSTVLVSAVGIAAATWLTWIVTRPILALKQAAQTVGQGDFSQHVTPWANDEIGELAQAFNAMTIDLGRVDQERSEREQLRSQLLEKVISAQEEERRRIARELHDETGQSLTSLMVRLQTLNQQCVLPELRPQIEEVRQLVAHTLEEVHNLSVELRPSVLDDLGLIAALQRYIQDYQHRHQIDVDFVVLGLGEERLPATIETALYRIVQEGLTNVARHAQAETVSVLLEQHVGRVRTIIEDDGIGFDPNLALNGERLGLYGIRERAELLNGTLTIESNPKRGTTIFVEVPV